VSRRLLSTPRWAAAALVLLFTVVGAVGGWAVEHAKGPQFQASTDVLVRFWSVESFLLSDQSTPVSSSDVVDAATLADSPDVLNRAAAALHDSRTGNDLATSVVVTPSSDSNDVNIAATAADPATARRTSAAVANAMISALDDRIKASIAGLPGGTEFQSGVAQRAEVLMQSVRPLVALTTSQAKQTAPTTKSLVAFAVVGLAAGTLLVIGARFARPTLEEPRVAQRLTQRPAVPFSLDSGSPEAGRMMRRLLDERPRGSILVLPVEADSEKAAETFADWARAQTSSEAEAGRIVVRPEPAGAVLAPRPTGNDVAAVLVVTPRGTARRTLSDAMSLLAPWRPADAIVFPT
jgi:capsular polysaccharide biosynthesis protein